MDMATRLSNFYNRPYLSLVISEEVVRGMSIFSGDIVCMYSLINNTLNSDFDTWQMLNPTNNLSAERWLVIGPREGREKGRTKLP